MSCHTFPDRDPALKARATIEHMPFKGHRNCSQWGPGSRGEYRLVKVAMDYGFDPDSLKASER